MKPTDLFYSEVESELKEWIKQFSSVQDLFENRANLYAKLDALNIQGTVEEGAVIEGSVHIGVGTIVRSCAVLRGPIVIGENTVIDSHAVIQGGVFIGSNCHISPHTFVNASTCFNHTSIRAGACLNNVVLGSGCYVGENSVIGAEKHKHKLQAIVSTLVGDDSFFASATILPEGVVLESKYSSDLGEIIK
jgi:NDP-sugar pyrophosphorylase family protein